MRELNDIAEELGFILDEKQPHLAGERRVFASHKSVLFGRRRSDGVRAVLKISSDPEGIDEIRRERVCREALDRIRFAYGTFSSAEEMLFVEKDGHIVQAMRYIEQDMPFMERPVREQFHLALKGLKAMEAAHAATHEHQRSVRGIFPTMEAEDYLRGLSGRSHEELLRHSDDVERYCGFLTHFDYMPQNIRIADGTMYLLDHSSLRFGNKHESWARFINFMTLYNPELAAALEQYVRDNRAPEESVSLRLMRIYRLEELVAHHARIAEKSEALHDISRARVVFWEKVLDCVFETIPVPEEAVTAYKAARDRLRSPEEVERQKDLH